VECHSTNTPNLDDPLTGATWTQSPEELDVLVGQARVTVSSAAPGAQTCTRGKEGAEGELHVTLLVDGSVAYRQRVSASPSGREARVVNLLYNVNIRNISGPGAKWLFEPSKVTTHVVTVATRDTCGEEGGIATEHFTINSISIDVVGVR